MALPRVRGRGWRGQGVQNRVAVPADEGTSARCIGPCVWVESVEVCWGRRGSGAAGEGAGGRHGRGRRGPGLACVRGREWRGQGVRRRAVVQVVDEEDGVVGEVGVWQGCIYARVHLELVWCFSQWEQRGKHGAAWAWAASRGKAAMGGPGAGRAGPRLLRGQEGGEHGLGPQRV